MSDTTRIVIGLLIILAGIVFAVNIFRNGNQPEEAPEPIVQETIDNYLDITPDFPKNYILDQGAQAPEFTYATMDNQIFNLADYQNRKYVVLNFFETDSPYCQRQINELQEFYSLYGTIVEVVGVTSQPADQKNIIANFLRQNNIEFPILHDPSGTIGDVYRHDYEPFFAFIGKDGIVIEGYTGTIYEFHYAAWDLFNWIGPSEVESNDIKTEADRISALTINGHCHPYDTDWYVLTGQERTESTYTLTYDDTQASISLEVYSHESLIGVLNDGHSPDSGTFRVPGTCYLKVWIAPCQEGAYTITIEPK